MPRNKSMDFDKPYGTIRVIGVNKGGVRYQQGDSYYNSGGEYVSPAAGVKAPAAKAPPVPQAAKKTAADLKRDALNAAADKLGLDTVPKTLQDAAKENAEALAAEDNA